MNFLKRNLNVILVCLLEALVGVLLLINPVGFTSVIVIALGIVLLVGGVISIINYFRDDPVEASLKGELVKGLVMLLVGGIFVIRPAWLIAAFPFFTMICGIVILLGALYKVQWFADALRMKTGRWLFHALNAAISLICGVVILANPFVSTAALWMFIGISLIVQAVLDLLVLIFARKDERQKYTRF